MFIFQKEKVNTVEIDITSKETL